MCAGRECAVLSGDGVTKMKFSKLGVVLALFLSLLAAGFASAATVSFSGSTIRPVSEIDFTGSDGLTITASGMRANESGEFRRDALVGRYGGGLGVCSGRSTDSGSGCGRDYYQVDGNGANEMALLDFGSAVVRITEIVFTALVYNDDFDFALYGGSTADTLAFFDDARPNADTRGYVRSYRFTTDYIGSLFGIGADHWSDEFLIRSVSYENLSPVPLPAGGLLLLTALAGLGVARRRKAVAA